MLDILLGIVITLNLQQLLNVPSSMLVILSGIVILVRLLQLPNA